MGAFGQPGLACQMRREQKGKIRKLYGFTVTMCDRCFEGECEVLRRAREQKP